MLNIAIIKYSLKANPSKNLPLKGKGGELEREGPGIQQRET